MLAEVLKYCGNNKVDRRAMNISSFPLVQTGPHASFNIYIPQLNFG
jgi:hypothetical protein